MYYEYNNLRELTRSQLAKVYEVTAELIREGRCDELTPLVGDEKTLLSVDTHHTVADDPIRGVLLYRESEPGEWWVQIAWVHPDVRRAGEFTSMWKHLKRKAQRANIEHIIFAVAHDNAEMLKVMAKLEAVPVSRVFKVWTDPGAIHE